MSYETRMVRDGLVAAIEECKSLRARAESAEHERDAILEWAAKYAVKPYHYGGGKVTYAASCDLSLNRRGETEASTPEAAIRKAAGLEETT